MGQISKFGAAALPLLLACSGPAAETCPAGTTEAAAGGCVEQVQQAGRSYQGRSYQGRSYQGAGPAVSTILGISVGGVAVEGVEIQGTVLKGTVGGQTLSGADFIGATVTQVDGDWAFDATITNVQADPGDPSGEVLLYTLKAQNLDTGTLDNICDPDPWGGQYATPIYGSWDQTGARQNITTDMMFGCTSGVVAKCVRWGYKPWKTVNGKSLADYHQACTRMARADYCGDGVSHTMDATLIDMYDDLRIQEKTPFQLLSPLLFDAAWTPKGAYCMAKDRWLQLLSLATVTVECKTKFLNLFPLLETSPVDSSDLCLIKRSDVARSEVRIDNRSALNISLN